MTNVKKIAGIDVSKEFFDVCVLIENAEHCRQFSYDKTDLTELIKWLPADGHCVMEATGPYYLRLACWLHQHGFSVSVINPLVIRQFCRMRLVRAKTDKADARMIAAYGVTENLCAWTPPAQYMITLQQLDAMVELMTKQRTATINQLEAFTASGMMEKDTKMFLMRCIEQTDKKLQNLQFRIDKIISQFHAQLSKQLTSIPGIGKKAAAMLIVATAGFTKFRSYKQLSAYIGLSPRIYQSGKSVKGKGRICKMGMSRARALLYMCSMTAKQWNKGCKELYDRLVAKGKPGRLALIAVANKLVKQAFAVATNNTTYVSDYSKNICF